MSEVPFACCWYVYRTDKPPVVDSFLNVFFKHMVLTFPKQFLSENSQLPSYAGLDVEQATVIFSLRI